MYGIDYQQQIAVPPFAGGASEQAIGLDELPRRCTAALVLPAALCLEQTVVLPQAMNPKRLRAYFAGQASLLFGLPLEQLNLGFRIHSFDEQLIAHLCVIKKEAEKKLVAEFKQRGVKLNSLCSPITALLPTLQQAEATASLTLSPCDYHLKIKQGQLLLLNQYPQASHKTDKNWLELAPTQLAKGALLCAL